MNNQRPLPNLEHDYRVFLWFLTITTIGMYVWAVTTQSDLRQKPLLLALCTLVVIVYTGLHWFTDRVYNDPRRLAGYIALQGVLSLIIVLLTKVLFMNFVLFMALIGEAIGMMGLSRRALLACGYYLVLSLVAFLLVAEPSGAIWWLVGAVPTVVFVVTYVTLYNRQAEANERARELLAELETANHQLSEYSAQVEDLTIAAERQRMARELHDTLSQGLAGLILQLEAADAHLAQDHPEKARQIVQHTMQQARVTLGEARRAIDDLRSGTLPTLEETVRQEVDRFSTASGIPSTLEVSLPVEIPPVQRDAIARILAEALNNILHHAQASQVSVALCSGENGVQLEINDNGVGFNPEAARPGHYGLIGIGERARLAGGKIEIHSQPGAGTRLAVHFPPPEAQA
jgi:NarL family two-component system sensor histidine kinase YdfH